MSGLCESCVQVPFERLLPIVRGRAPTGRAFAPVFAAARSFVVALGVTMRTAGRDLGAADPRVEGVIGPLDFAVGAHDLEINDSASGVRFMSLARQSLRRLDLWRRQKASKAGLLPIMRIRPLAPLWVRTFGRFG